MKEINIHLTSEMFQAFLQGKKLVWNVVGQPIITIFPPHYGLYFTHEQIAEIQRCARIEGSRELVELIDKISKLKDEYNK